VYDGEMDTTHILISVEAWLHLSG